MLNVTDASFESEVLNSDIPVVVDFWADWCNPCKAMLPTLESLSTEMGNVKFVKMCVDENTIIPAEYTIRSIPTLIIFKNSEVVDFITGLQSKEKLKSSICKFI
jgi:thioredoxin 1